VTCEGVNHDGKKTWNVCWNNAYRKAFGLHVSGISDAIAVLL